MDDLISELERLHGHALLHASQMQAAPSYWPHTPDGTRAVGLMINNLPRLLAMLKAAEGMREATDRINQGAWFTEAITAHADARRAFESIRDIAGAAIAAYDTAKGA